MGWIGLLLYGLALAMAVPVLTFALQCWVAALGHRRRSGDPPAAVFATPADASSSTRPSCAIVVPAHDEADVLAGTLQHLKTMIRESDRIVVIADNCSDDTASIARGCDVEVIERIDADRRGKGFAMQCGVDALRGAPPSVVVFVDADCRVAENAIDRLVQKALQSNAVIQAKYLMRRTAMLDGSSSTKQTINEFAVLVKNHVRPLGMSRLGGPVHLTGSGMAFPWHRAKGLAFASGNIVEDMALGCELMRRGEGPQFCESAEVTAPLPSSAEASLEQRRRWEHGHLHTLTHHAPRLFWSGLKNARPATLLAACDLTVPPLTLLVMILLGGFVAAAVFAPVHAGPLLVISLELAAIASALVVAACRFSTDRVFTQAIVAAPSYLFSKIPLYLSYALFGRQRQWVRTSRS